jgi:hypothetical protein
MEVMSAKSHSGSKSGDPKPATAAASKPERHGSAKPPTWRQDDGAPVSCLEKIKVLNENYAELQQMAQDAFEDALLIGCSEAQVRSVLHELVDGLTNPYPGTKTSGLVKPHKR